MTKYPFLLLAFLLFVPSMAFAKPVEVFTTGDAEKTSARFHDKNGRPIFFFLAVEKERMVPPRIAARQTMPIIPREKRRPNKRTSDRVTLGLVITGKGKVLDAAVIATTDSIFNPSAITAVQTWEFSPALVEGKPVASYVEVSIDLVVEKY